MLFSTLLANCFKAAKFNYGRRIKSSFYEYKVVQISYKEEGKEETKFQGHLQISYFKDDILIEEYSPASAPNQENLNGLFHISFWKLLKIEMIVEESKIQIETSELPKRTFIISAIKEDTINLRAFKKLLLLLIIL